MRKSPGVYHQLRRKCLVLHDVYLVFHPPENGHFTPKNSKRARMVFSNCIFCNERISKRQYHIPWFNLLSTLTHLVVHWMKIKLAVQYCFNNQCHWDNGKIYLAGNSNSFLYPINLFVTDLIECTKRNSPYLIIPRAYICQNSYP